MPRIDFAAIEETEGFEPLPPGRYRIAITDVDKRETKSGDEMWNLRLMVIGGEWRNSSLFDRLVFSERGCPRVKLICARLGLDVSKAIDLKPEMLLDRTAVVTVEQREYLNANGETKLGNNIPWAGWDRDPGPAEEGGRGGDAPF